MRLNLIKLWLCIISVLAMLSACTTEKPEINDTNTDSESGVVEPSDKPEVQVKEISILAIGNSFSVDAMEYLWGILDQAGYESITLGNLYVSGCSLEKHAGYFESNSASYTYYTNTTGTWSNTKNYAPLTALKSHEWDIITMQQSSGVSGVPSSYEPYLTNLINIVKTHCPDAEIAWHMTWAYQGDSTHKDFPTYNSDQMTMYNSIVSTVKNTVLAKKEIKKVIPNGTSVQNLRTSFVGDNITRDGYHMSHGNGRYVTALTFAKSLTGCDLIGITYTPSTQTYSEKEIIAMKEAANNACTKPYEVTVSAYQPDPAEADRDYKTAALTDIIKWKGYNPDNYTQMNIEVIKYAYYNSTNKTFISKLYTKENSSSANLDKLIATPIYEMNDLPYGTLIVQREGQQYRPEGWTALDVANESSARPGFETACVIEVNEAWWSNWNYRAFNLAKEGRPVLTEQAAEEVIEGFGIFVPKKQ